MFSVSACVGRDSFARETNHSFIHEIKRSFACATTFYVPFCIAPCRVIRMAVARKTTELVPLMLRLREGLRKQLEKAAKAHDQSLNTEVNDRLERSFERERQEARDTRILNALAGPDARSRDILYEMVRIVALPRHERHAHLLELKALFEANAMRIRDLLHEAIPHSHGEQRADLLKFESVLEANVMRIGDLLREAAAAPPEVEPPPADPEDKEKS
jgi:predicted HicB family RNase H-like nuclease